MIEEFMKDYYGCETIEFPFGFFSFKHEEENNVMFVQQFYIRLSERNSLHSREMWNEMYDVCKKRNIPLIEAVVDLSLGDATHNLIVFNQVGFKVVAAHNNNIVVHRKIGEYDGR